MKRILFLSMGAALMIASSVRAGEDSLPAPRFTRATVEQTVQSLVMALESKSPGLQVTAAQTVRDLKTLMPERSFSRVVIPLMRIVKSDDTDPDLRVVAAIALHGLHSAIGDFAIAREVDFCSCPKMRHVCAWLTYYQLLEDHPEVASRKYEEPNDIAMKLAQ